MRAPRFRPTQPVLVALALLVAIQAATAQEGATAPADAEESAMVDGPMFKLGWPKFEMPKFNWKPGFGGDDDVADTGASAMTAEGNPISRALDKVSDTSKNAAGRVRDAWGAAVEKLSFSGDKTAQTAPKESPKDSKPGFWSRMFAAEEPRQSETVQDFLAQERVGMTR